MVMLPRPISRSWGITGWRIMFISWRHIAAADFCILVLWGWRSLLDSFDPITTGIGWSFEWDWIFPSLGWALDNVSRDLRCRRFVTWTNSLSLGDTAADPSAADFKDLPTLMICSRRLVNWACAITSSSNWLLFDVLSLLHSGSVAKRRIPR